MTKCIGFWKLESQDDKWDDFMKAVGVGFATRQIGKRVSSWEEIVQNEDTWHLNITSTFKNSYLTFKLGEEFEEKTLDGRTVMSVFNIEDDKLMHFQKSTDVGIPDSVITRERTDENTLTVTFVAIGKDITSVRKFSKHTKGTS